MCVVAHASVPDVVFWLDLAESIGRARPAASLACADGRQQRLVVKTASVVRARL